jgi:hypothetical protein
MAGIFQLGIRIYPPRKDQLHHRGHRCLESTEQALTFLQDICHLLVNAEYGIQTDLPANNLRPVIVMKSNVGFLPVRGLYVDHIDDLTS